jgi:EpsI family protein
MPNSEAIPIVEARGDAASGRGLGRSHGVALAIVVLVAAVGLGMADLWAVLHSQWVGIALYEHGYLVAAMSAWLGWRSFRTSAPAAVAPDWRWAPLFGAVLALLILFDLLFLNVPRVLLIPPLVVAGAGLVFGRAVAMRVLWPMVLLYSAMPVWVPLTSVLQSLTTAVVSRALAATGVPAYIEGNFVHLPAGTFEIAEDCSGLRYVVIATTLLLFYALAFLPTWRRRCALLAVGVAGAIVCNWLRVYVIVVAGHLTDMQHYLVRVDHTVFGWVLFAAFLVPVLWVARRLEGPPRAAPASSTPVVDGRGVAAAACIAAALLMLPRLAAIAESRVGAHVEPAVAEVAPPLRDFAWRPVFAKALEEHEIYGDGDAAVEAYRARYPRQDADHRLIAYGNTFMQKGWQAVRQDRVAVTANGTTFDVLELEGYLNSSRRLVWAWYSVAGETATGPLEAKLLELQGLFAGRRDAAAFAVAAQCDVNCDAARRRLEAFLRESPEFLQTRWLEPSGPKDRRSARTMTRSAATPSFPDSVRRES